MNCARRRAVGLFIPVVVTLSVLVAACSSASPSPLLVEATPTPSPSVLPTPTATPEPPAPGANARLLDHRFTVLVVGQDTSAQRTARGYLGRNTDSIMVVSVSADQKRVVMLSLPRDTVDVPLGNGAIWTAKVNGIASQYGLDGLRKAIESLLGIDVPYYVKVDMDDFVSLVDAVGGVDVKVKTYVQEPRWGLYLQPGHAHLDGLKALYFTRARYFDNDYARAARQQQVVRALVRKYTDPDTHIRIFELLQTLAELETNLEVGDLRTLVVLGRRASRASFTAAVLSPPRFAIRWGDQHDGRGWVIVPNIAEMRAYARSLIRR
jgi:LCP family protein required for cell wall assembly